MCNHGNDHHFHSYGNRCPSPVGGQCPHHPDRRDDNDPTEPGQAVSLQHPQDREGGTGGCCGGEEGGCALWFPDHQRRAVEAACDCETLKYKVRAGEEVLRAGEEVLRAGENEIRVGRR